MAKTTITPKQAQVKLTSLLRGLDNSAITLNKQREQIQQIAKSAKEIGALVSGLANQKPEKPKASTKSTKPVKVAKAAKAAKAKKPAKAKAVSKPAKTVKTSKPKPQAAKPKSSPPKAVAAPADVAPASSNGAPKSKPAKSNPPPVAGRPTIKEAIKEVLTEAGKALPASEIWHKVVDKYGSWSRQSCYNALENKVFAKSEQGFSLSSANESRDEADSFVDSLEPRDSAEAVSTVV